MKKFLLITLLTTLTFLSTTKGASAHVVVKPGEVGVGSFQTFTVSVPVEKDNPTNAVRLVLPKGLKHITPTVKQGWTTQVGPENKEGEVTEITWFGGSIPPHYRDEFTFSAQVPPSPTTLQWKAYQIYDDGATVNWDQDPATIKGHDITDKGPYSTTKVINDLSTTEESNTTSTPPQKDNMPLYLSLIAVLMSGFSLWKVLNRKN
jgi:uncharacterized protein YcnI